MNINYTLPSGKTAVITDEPKKNFDGTISAKVTARVQGVSGIPEMGLARPAELPAWAVSAIGRLPLTTEMDAQVRAAVAAVDAEYASHNDCAIAHLAELATVSANSARVARRMAY